MSFAARNLTRRHFRRRHLIGWIVTASLALWIGLWVLASSHINGQIDEWISAAKKDGIEISFSKRFTNGSPFSIHTHLDDLKIKTPAGYNLYAQESVLYMGLTDWRDFSIKLRKKVSGSIAGHGFKADVFKLGFVLPEKSQPQENKEALSLWLHPVNLIMENEKPFIFGDVIEEAMADIRIMVGLPNFSDPSSLKIWNDLGGVIEFDRLYLDWGKIILTANGTIGIDPNMQLEGAFSSRVEGIDIVLEKLVMNKLIDERQQKTLASTLQVFSRPSGIIGKSAPIVPLSLQNGGLYLGPVKLMNIPKFSWDKTQEKQETTAEKETK